LIKMGPVFKGLVVWWKQSMNEIEVLLYYIIYCCII